MKTYKSIAGARYSCEKVVEEKSRSFSSSDQDFEGKTNWVVQCNLFYL